MLLGWNTFKEKWIVNSGSKHGPAWDCPYVWSSIGTIRQLGIRTRSTLTLNMETVGCFPPDNVLPKGNEMKRTNWVNIIWIPQVLLLSAGNFFPRFKIRYIYECCQEWEEQRVMHERRKRGLFRRSSSLYPTSHISRWQCELSVTF